MGDEAIKKRMSRAKRKARMDLESIGFEVIESNNRPVCLVAKNGDDIRVIRICLNKISPADRLSICTFSEFRREVWCRKEGSEEFSIQKI